MTTIQATSSIAIGISNDSTIATFPLKVCGGDLVSTPNLPEHIIISGADCFHPDVLVSTTKKEIDDMMESTSKDHAKIIFPRVWNVIKNANSDTLYSRGGKEWSDFMNDIIIYYVCRYKLFDTPFPAVFNERVDEQRNALGGMCKGIIDLRS
jgi:hypothetical protein